MKAFKLLPVALLAASGLLLAIDQDGDQISDVYAQHYGVASGSTHDDPDGDGQSNFEESMWGTHPFDNSSKQTTNHILASGLYNFSITTVPGKRYRFQGTPGLKTDWENIDNAFTGTGGTEHLQITIPVYQQDKFFWRVKALPAEDADLDDLTAYEEHLLGTSDQARDSDGDKIADAVEFAQALNPASNENLDDDDLPDDWENFYGLDPNSGTGDDGNLGNPDGDNLTNLQEFQQQRNPNEHEDTPQGIPAKPVNLITSIHTDGSRTYTWEDVSDNEDYFFITIRSRSGNTVRVADNIPSNTTTYHVDAATIEAALQQ